MNRFRRVIGIVVMMLMLIDSVGSAVFAEEGSGAPPDITETAAPSSGDPDGESGDDTSGGEEPGEHAPEGSSGDDGDPPSDSGAEAGSEDGEGSVTDAESSSEAQPAGGEEDATTDASGDSDTDESGDSDASTEASTDLSTQDARQSSVSLLQESSSPVAIVDARCDGTLTIAVQEPVEILAVATADDTGVGSNWRFSAEPGQYTHDFWADGHSASTADEVVFAVYELNEFEEPLNTSYQTLNCSGRGFYDVEQFELSCDGVLTVQYGARSPDTPLYSLYDGETGTQLGSSRSASPQFDIEPGVYDSLRVVGEDSWPSLPTFFIAEATVTGCLDEDPQPEIPTIVGFTVDMPDACAFLGGGGTVSGTSQLSGPLPEDLVGATITVGWETSSGEVRWGHAHDGLMPSWSMSEFAVNGPWSITMPPWDPEIRPTLFGPDRPGDATAFFARLELAEYVAGAEPLDSETIRIPLDSCGDLGPDPDPIDVIVQTIIRIILEILARLNA